MVPHPPTQVHSPTYRTEQDRIKYEVLDLAKDFKHFFEFWQFTYLFIT